MRTDTGDLKNAFNAAYRLIKYRDRSAKEMAERLRKKGFYDDVCGNVIAELKRLGYLDDMRFAKALAEDVLRFKPAGIEFIRSKLRSKGISADIADSVISGVKEGYNEREAAYKLAVKRADKMINISTDKAKQRIYGILARRRFERDTILEILDKIYDK